MPQQRKRRKANRKRARKAAPKPEAVNEDDVKSIYYVDDDGGQIDMTTIDRKRQRGKWIALFFVILILLSGVTYLGYRVFDQGTGDEDGGVELTLEVDEKVASGDLVTIEVSYTNNKNVDLASGTVELFYPQGFYVQTVSEEAADEDQRTWNFENVAPGTGDTIRITGQLVGGQGDIKNFSSLITYQPSNFSHDFQETAEARTEITSSIITMDVEAPSQVQAGQEFTYTVSYTNTSTAPLTNVKLALNYPEGFTYVDSTAPPTSSNREWRVDEFAPNETQEVSVTGTLNGNSGDTKELIAEFGIIELDNSFSVQVEKSSIIVIVNPEIDLFISAPETAEPGDALPLTVSVNNTSEVEMKDVKIKLEFDGPFFREESHEFEAIELLLPNTSFDLEYTATLKDRPDKNNYEMQVRAIALSANVEGNSVELPDEAEVQMKVKGSLNAAAYGRYFDDDLKKVGSGPVPPEVGETTTYQVVWNVETVVNEMRTVNMTTVLPAGVQWEKDSSNAVTYDSSTRQVTYTKDTIPADSDRTVFFTVSITPAASDVDSLMVLTEQTVVSAVDGFTGENISYELERITTDLPEDEGAAGKGVVVE